MRSLRARLLAILLVLTAIGLLLAGAVTYVEQRNFLYDRVDRQLQSSRESVQRALGGQAYAHRGGMPGRPPGLGAGGRPPGRPGDDDFGPAPGTYGEVRDADGVVEDSITLGYGEEVSSTPDLPDHVPVDKLFTVDATGLSGPRYRVQATRQPNGELLVVAMPLAEEDQALDRLLLVEGIVIAAVLLALAAIAWVVVRVGLLPLDRMGHTANAIAGGDLSARVDTTDPRTEVGRLGIALNAMLERLESAFAQRQASEDRLRQFLADASHELRTPLASIRGYAELYRMGALRGDAETERAMSRVEDEAARMGVLVEDLLTLARLDEVAEAPHVDLDLVELASDAVDDARATAPERDITLHADGEAARARGCPPAAPGAGQPAAQRARAHPRRHADRGVRERGRRRRGADRARPRTRPARGRCPTRCSSASGAARPGASAAARAPAWAWPSSPRSSAPTAAACRRPTRPAAAPRSPSPSQAFSQIARTSL